MFLLETCGYEYFTSYAQSDLISFSLQSVLFVQELLFVWHSLGC